jgi:hypothetical protein
MSKMKNCKVCSKEIAKSAKTCPHCGAKLKMGLLKKVGIGFGILIVIGIIGSLGSNDSSTSTNSDSSKSTTSTQQKTTTNTNNEKPKEEPKKEEPKKQEPSKPNWNMKELDATKNGNIQIAVKQLQSAGDIKQNAVVAEPATVNKSPWNYYGKIVKMTGVVEVVQDYPPASDVAKMLGGKDASEIVLSTEDDTIVDMFAAVSSGSLKVGDIVTVYGYPVGQAEVDNKIGGKFTHLILVGNAFDK